MGVGRAFGCGTSDDGQQPDGPPQPPGSAVGEVGGAVAVGESGTWRDLAVVGEVVSIAHRAHSRDASRLPSLEISVLATAAW